VASHEGSAFRSGSACPRAVKPRSRRAETTSMDTSSLTVADKLAIADTTLRIAVAMFLALIAFSELLTFASS